MHCTCGSRRFRPVGIQGSWAGRQTGRSPRVLYLVNCSRCGTTRVCDGLQYALLQSREAAAALEINFFTDDGKVAA